ncbi:MAG: DUF4450 domain-containing protein [Prevotella sp.]|nr:DUF4450 domain-containing protein [Prevotella sp.]
MISSRLRQANIALMLMLGLSAWSQKTVGDFIESRSNNESRRGAARTHNYYPEDGAFVCENGQNRYTRALYGGHTDYRVETSDRPIFAVFKKGYHRNVRFTVNGVQADSAAYCKAWYKDACRSYLLRDSRFGASPSAALRIAVVALQDEEGAVFRFTAEGMDRPLDVRALVCNLSGVRMHRNGDIGADPKGVFEPAADNAGLVVSGAVYDKARTTAYVVMRLNKVVDVPFAEAEALWRKTVAHNEALAGRVTFSTPDPYINTLGGALVVAADGDWDGQTWLHGCVGWRMPLAGWRAGYLGDVLGWDDRAVSHFDAYAKSQVTDVAPTIPHPSMDPKMNMARAEKKWGTQMYSNGYICRNPEKNNQMHHYDMNLNYMDELLWHFCYNADTAYMRKMWPVIASHLAWEKRNYDPDGDGLYDAYCCIWASDALYYSGGAVTHSSAYNYRGNLLAARIADIIGEDGAPYRAEAARILKAMNSRLWLNGRGHWAEFEESLGLKRKHESAALWSVYTPIDCGAGSPEQFWQATEYVDREIPHIPVEAEGKSYGSVISTSNWHPYAWSINNVAAAEIMHTALAYFEAGRADAGYALMRANIMDQMYLGDCPGNFGQVSFYDAARGECYRDFGDCIGISSRTLLQGLFGIVPDALNGRCIIRPGFPASWDSASVSTPYMTYKYRREGGKDIFDITQRFARPLKIVVRHDIGHGRYTEIEGSAEEHQTIVVDRETPINRRIPRLTPRTEPTPRELGLDEPAAGRYVPVKLGKALKDNVTDIFNNEYLSPRSPYTTLQIPVQGVGEWCHPTLKPEINDSVFRTLVRDGRFTVAGVPFLTPAEGHNIAYTSLWDNYPDSITVPLSGRASAACLLMAGSTNHMQSRIDNGLVVVAYKDGTADTLRLVNPDNWCPIEQDYFEDGKAFTLADPRPYRVCLGNGKVSRNLGDELGITGVYGRPIPGGAAQMLNMPLDPEKKLKSLTVRTLSGDVVIGLMGVTLVR